MNNSVSNPCIRCGKERILSKKWIEEVPGYSNKMIKITRSLTVCPDAECQKIVDAELALLKKKRDKMKADREARNKASLSKRKFDKKLT